MLLIISKKKNPIQKKNSKIKIPREETRNHQKKTSNQEINQGFNLPLVASGGRKKTLRKISKGTQRAPQGTKEGI